MRDSAIYKDTEISWGKPGGFANCYSPTVSEAGEEHTVSETLYLGVLLNVPFHHCYFRTHNAVCPGTCAHVDLCELVTRRAWVCVSVSACVW